jgi:hypothetical protein
MKVGVGECGAADFPPRTALTIAAVTTDAQVKTVEGESSGLGGLTSG